MEKSPTLSSRKDSFSKDAGVVVEIKAMMMMICFVVLVQTRDWMRL
jgi:hypothetical protein